MNKLLQASSAFLQTFIRFNIIVLNVLVVIFLGSSCTSKPFSVAYIEEIYSQRDGGEFTDAQIEQIFSVIERNPETLNQDMPEPSNVTSGDGNLRAYTVERCGFGGDPTAGYEIHTLFQYRNGEKIGVTAFDETFTDIRSITHLGQNKYLVIDEIALYHQGYHYTMTAKVVEITDNGVIIDHQGFIDGQDSSAEITVNWSETDLEVDYIADGIKANLGEDEEFLDKMLFYNTETKELYANTTVTTVNGNFHVTETYTRYEWDDDNFVNITIMNPIEAYNEDYYIRIEQHPDGSCVYKCWNGGKKIGKPNLTIINGQRLILGEMTRCRYNEWMSDDASTPRCEQYIFENDGFSYMFTDGWLRGNYECDLDVYAPEGNQLYNKSFKIVENP